MIDYIKQYSLAAAASFSAVLVIFIAMAATGIRLLFDVMEFALSYGAENFFLKK